MHKLILKYKSVLLIVIVLLGFFLRFYMLGDNPPSLNWDEASTGYNAFSILKTGKDEYGNFLPLSIRSFDDYKPALYTYLAVPFVSVLGVNEEAIRLPSAILGTLSILILYFLILEFFPKEKWADEIALMGAFLFSISPWSLQFSRAAYEGNIGVFFLLTGLLFFLKSLKKHSYIFVSAVFLILSMYSYHSFRLVVPLLLLAILILFFKNLWTYKKQVIIALIMFALLVIPVYSSFLLSGSGTGSRLSMVTLFGASPNLDHAISELSYDKAQKDSLGEILHNRRIVYFLAITKGYLDHYNPDFLFLHGDGGRQHHAVDMGMLYLLELPFILMGFVFLTKNLNRRVLLLCGFMLLAPLPSAITTGTPHPVRAIAMLPVFIILSAVGLVWFLDRIGENKYRFAGIRLKQAGLFIVVLLALCNVTYYLHQYYVHTPIEYGDFWQYGYKEAFEVARKNEKNVDRIVVTYKYDQPYIYYLLYNKIDPAWYQKNWDFMHTGELPRFERRIGKYEFRNINWGEDQKLKNTLFIGTPEELPVGTDQVKFLNGDTAFRIIKT